MSSRKIKYKPNTYIKSCPKCGNNTEFTIRSEQVYEDGCEIWAICKCGYDPTSYEYMGSSYRVEDVWGGCGDDNCQDAITHSWNGSIEDLEEKLNSDKNAKECDATMPNSNSIAGNQITPPPNSIADIP
jgi:hypothetical protein